MEYQAPAAFSDVMLICKVNVYFNGKVISHTVIFAYDSRKTIGLIYPGIYRFDMAAPERKEIIVGTCRVRFAGREDWTGLVTGTWFDVPGQSFFEIEIVDGIAE